MGMELVTRENLPDYLAKYAAHRGGEMNEETASEAAFVVVTKYRGAYILHTGIGPIWIGIQSASARWSRDGRGAPFASVRAALEDALDQSHPTARDSAVYYSENSSERLRFIADKIEEFKSSGTFLLWA